MKVITRRRAAADVPARIRRQYEGRLGTYPDMAKKLARVEALGRGPDPDDVAAIMGEGWLSRACNECEEEADPVVEVGDEPDYESSTAWVCLDCLRGAVAMAEGVMRDEGER